MIQETIQRTVDLACPRELVQVLVVIEAGDDGTIAKVNEKLAQLHVYGIGGRDTGPGGARLLGFPRALRPDAASRANARGCPFADRCPARMPVCIEQRPPLFQADPDRVVSCFVHRQAPVIVGDELSRVLGQAAPTHT